MWMERMKGQQLCSLALTSRLLPEPHLMTHHHVASSFLPQADLEGKLQEAQEAQGAASAAEASLSSLHTLLPQLQAAGAEAEAELRGLEGKGAGTGQAGAGAAASRAPSSSSSFPWPSSSASASSSSLSSQSGDGNQEEEEAEGGVGKDEEGARELAEIAQARAVVEDKEEEVEAAREAWQAQQSVVVRARTECEGTEGRLMGWLQEMLAPAQPSRLVGPAAVTTAMGGARRGAGGTGSAGGTATMTLPRPPLLMLREAGSGASSTGAGRSNVASTAGGGTGSWPPSSSPARGAASRKPAAASSGSSGSSDGSSTAPGRQHWQVWVEAVHAELQRGCMSPMVRWRGSGGVCKGVGPGQGRNGGRRVALASS